VLGQNLNVDARGYRLRTDRFPDVARELVKAKVDTILCGGDPPASDSRGAHHGRCRR